MPLATGSASASALAANTLQSGLPPKASRTSFAKCILPRLIAGPDGIPCRKDEEESCNQVHATCARAPKFGTEPDPGDGRFLRPKPPCKPGDNEAGGGPTAPGKLSKLAAAKELAKSAAAGGSELAGLSSARCSARMLDMPYGLENPEATDRDMGALRALGGANKAVNQESLPNTVWGMAVHGMSGTWAFDSHGAHAADYVYEVPQGKGAPSDYYLCDSRTNPQACALIGGNFRHACAEMYDARQCDYCEDKGRTLKCTIRGWNAKYRKWAKVPIYPRDLLGELYRGEWRDLMARPMWASVEFRKVDLARPVKKLPDHMIGDGPGKEALAAPGAVAKTPLWMNPVAESMPGALLAGPATTWPPPSPPPVRGSRGQAGRGRGRGEFL